MAFTFIYPYRILILLQISARISLIVYGKTWNGLTYSIRERENRRYIKYILLIFIRKTYILQTISRYYRSSRTILEVNILIIRLSSISGNYKYTSLYRVTIYIIL